MSPVQAARLIQLLDTIDEKGNVWGKEREEYDRLCELYERDHMGEELTSIMTRTL